MKKFKFLIVDADQNTVSVLYIFADDYATAKSKAEAEERPKGFSILS